MESQSQLIKHPQQHTDLDREDVDVHEHGGVQKQSVLMKVKAKAKKIRDTIKNHGHHQPHEGHDDQPRENRQELRHDDDDDEDEDEFEEMENDSEVLGAPIYDSQVATSTSTPNQGLMHHEPNMERTDEQGKDNTRLGVPTSHGLVHHQQNVERIDVPTSHGAEEFKPESAKITENVSLKEDVEAPRSTLEEAPLPGNDEAKVSDPTGAGVEEIHRIAPLLHSFDKISNVETARGSHGQLESHDKISDDKLAAGSNAQLESDQHRKYRDMPDDSPLITGEAVEQDISLQGGGYGEKLALATAASADEVVAPKEAASSKLGYEDEKIDETVDQLDQTSYTAKASQAASLLADKAMGMKDAVASKLGYGETEEHKTPREPVDHEALMQQSGYMGNVSSVASTIADKAVEAKNVVASKLGYDQTSDAASSTKPTEAESAGGYTIMDKAAQVKNAVASKLGYGPGEEGGHPTETSKWAEKLKPGDDDKALSELITGSVFKGSPRKDDISDQERELLSDSKVTESEEVARRFGTSEEEKKGDLTQIPGSESPKKDVVDKIKGAVSSLWIAGDQTLELPRTEFIDQTGTQPNAGVRRFEESAN